MMSSIGWARPLGRRKTVNSNQWAVISGEIDRPLARHYGLSPAGEELDFIINYDVKYRMGASAEMEDENEDA